MDDFFRSMMGGGMSGESSVYKTAADAQEALRKFVATPYPDLKAGDLVERNELGKKKYRMPRENEAAMIVKVFEPDTDRDGNMVNALICIAFEDGDFKTFKVDTRFYQLAREKKKIFSIRGGK